MPTIQDVAKRAGVAPITVSRVLNHTGYIREETRQKVEAAIAELGYVPNSLARGLRIKQTKTIGLVLTDITNPFFTILARGVEDVASQAGFNVFLCNTDESESKQMGYLTALLQKRVDGILMVPAGSTTVPVDLIRDHGAEVVVIDRRLPTSQVDVIRCESIDSSYRLVSHLLELGHVRITILTGPRGVSTAEDRLSGYKAALVDAGVEIDDALIHYGRFTQESGYEMAQKAMRYLPMPTAMFTANNFIAIGAVKAVQEAGLQIPEDISIVTFDDLPNSLVINPFFTAIRQPSYEMGHSAAELLLARLSGGEMGPYREIILPTEFLVRASSAAPPTSKSQFTRKRATR
ncbi:MAG: LacI family DNA-binding transcriptional regulator [Anaerolineae bacterium]|nr:LacI family DNA-binding transcriptional regulator [Anaerolineae bacterium]